MKLTTHLEETGETYFQHMGFALRIALVLFICSLLAVVHSLFPWLLKTAVSNTIWYMNNYLQARGEKTGEE